MQDIQNHKLGETNEMLLLETFGDNRAVALAMAQQAQRSLCIFTHDLDPSVYDTDEFAEAVAQLARSGAYTQVKILVQNSSLALRNGHHLVRLAQRLTSKIEIRNPAEEYAGIRQAFFVVDETGYIERHVAESFQAVANFDNRLEARNLMKLFNEIWNRSHHDPELVRMHI